MSKSKGFTDVIVISSSSSSSSSDDDDDYQDEIRDLVTATKMRATLVGAKRYVSPSSVEVKTEKTKRDDEVDDDDDDDDDCCILDFNPFESAAADLVTKLSLADGDDSDLDEEEISILSVKGEVACRDFPHSRHLCGEFLFEKTPHESYCPQCYCYVCDTPAPCKTWKGSLLSHCHASDKQLMWKDLRTAHRKKESELKS
ncbi:uncharacterized protein A4U43_C04F16770 [Asparagus officinalis]|uniref:Uncharacterized protein n=1 Tax=Asparagus officinalis TaxID=4686 RepID=A0A5P1F1F1_ASPOF|nr:uncharacterized protein LOC109837441 [Asparagus officinalis]ONK72196.1 uncharacterized protein A4U43_C04F16770 [Asparagus officinalis]